MFASVLIKSRRIAAVLLLFPLLLIPAMAGSDSGLGTAVNPTILFVPFGTWRMCQVNPQLANTMFCPSQAPYQAGQEPDLLIISTERAETTAFAYTVTGTDVNGKLRTFTGVFQRNDSPPSIIGSYTIVNAGILHNLTVNLRELAAISSIQQQNLSMPGVD